MKIKLLKNWGFHKKGDFLTITDKTVIKKGLEVGLFEDAKKVVKAKKQ